MEPESNSNNDDNDNIGEAKELQNILDSEEASPMSRSRRVDEVCLNLTSAALALVTEEAAIVYVVLLFKFSY